MTNDAAKKLLICIHGRFGGSVSCDARGAGELVLLFERELAAQGLAGRLETIDCFGLCSLGTNVRFAPGGDFIHRVDPDQVPKIVGQFRAFCGPDCGPLVSDVKSDPVAEAFNAMFGAPRRD